MYIYVLTSNNLEAISTSVLCVILHSAVGYFDIRTRYSKKAWLSTGDYLL